MTDHRDRNDATEPDPDADRWSAWLPPLDPTSDHTGAAGPTPQPGPPLPQTPGPPLPQSSGPPPVPPAAPAQPAKQTYRSAPPPSPVGQQWAFTPRRHLGLSIFATFFGFTPLGIVAIFLSLSVGRLLRAGRLADAERASRRARNWAIAALVLRVVWTLGYALMMGS